MSNNDNIFIIGDSRTQEDNPITHQYGKYFIGLVVNKKTDIIEKFESSSILKITNEFLSDIFVGKNILKDCTELEKEIDEKYFGQSKKAIIFALKDAIKRYESTK